MTVYSSYFQNKDNAASTLQYASIKAKCDIQKKWEQQNNKPF